MKPFISHLLRFKNIKADLILLELPSANSILLELPSANSPWCVLMQKQGSVQLIGSTLAFGFKCFLMWSPLVRRHLSYHLLWYIFQSSLHTYYTLQIKLNLLYTSPGIHAAVCGLNELPKPIKYVGDLPYVLFFSELSKRKIDFEVQCTSRPFKGS